MMGTNAAHQRRAYIHAICRVLRHHSLDLLANGLCSTAARFAGNRSGVNHGVCMTPILFPRRKRHRHTGFGQYAVILYPAVWRLKTIAMVFAICIA